IRRVRVFLRLRPPRSTPFPYTTLFRSRQARRGRRQRRPATQQSRHGAYFAPRHRRLALLRLCLSAPPSRRCADVVADGPALERRSEEHTSELQSLTNLLCPLLPSTNNH